MRTLKPICASLVHRCIEHRGRFYLGVSVLTHIPIMGRAHLGSEQKLWPLLAEHAPGFVEQSVPRVASEYLLYGTAYPSEQGAAHVDFGIRVGELSKKARAFGPRLLKNGRLVAQQPVEATPVVAELAYGGPAFAENPQGMGTPDQQTHEGLWLPRIELPSHPWHPDVSANQAALFGQLDIMHPLRQAGAGTYDSTWLKHDYPGLPRDADWAVFNTAPLDQRQTAAFSGLESFDLVNLHAQQARIHNQLPGVGARVLIKFKQEQDAHDLQTRLRSLVFLPDADAVVLVWQTQCQIHSDDARDVEWVLAGLEHLDRPRSAQHYQEVAGIWLDDEDGLLNALDESPLLPEQMAHDGLLDGVPDLNQPAESESLQARLRRKAEESFRQAREAAKQQGLDPDQCGPPAQMPSPPKFPPLHQLGPFFRQMEADANARMEAAEAHKQQQIEEAEQALSESGQKFEIRQAVAGTGPDAHRGPPPSCREPLPHSQEAMEQAAQDSEALNDLLHGEEWRQQWDALDRQALEAYRLGAHWQPPHPGLDGQAAEDKRAWVMQRLQTGEGLAEQDLTGADLSGLDLSEVDCRKALLESANLRGANLTGACLAGAVLAHARLDSAILSRCDLRQANLGKATLNDCQADHARFDRAELHQAEFAHSHLAGASFAGSQWYCLVFQHCDLTGADFSGSDWLECRIEHSQCQRVKLDNSNFVDCVFVETDWRQCTGRKAAFVNLRYPGINFHSAQLPASLWVGEVDLRAACFEDAKLDQAFFAPEARLDEARFVNVQAVQASFAGCSLRQASFNRACLKQASFRNADLSQADLSLADLMEASLQNARLEGARLRAVHLYAADLARIHTDARTDARGADYTKARIYPRHATRQNGS